MLVPWHVRVAGDERNLASASSVPVAPGGEQAAQHGRLDQQKQAVVFERYCHVYRAGELEALLSRLGPVVSVQRVYWDTGNWALLVQKN